MGERLPDRDEIVRHEETADKMAHDLRVSRWEHWMTFVDAGQATLDQAMQEYKKEIRTLGVTATDPNVQLGEE